MITDKPPNVEDGADIDPVAQALLNLAAAGVIVDSGRRRRGSNGLDQIVWVSNPALSDAECEQRLAALRAGRLAALRAGGLKN
jgi:hypothetical protein